MIEYLVKLHRPNEENTGPRRALAGHLAWRIRAYRSRTTNSPITSPYGGSTVEYELKVLRDVTHLGVVWMTWGFYKNETEAKQEVARVPRLKEYRVVKVEVVNPA